MAIRATPSEIAELVAKTGATMGPTTAFEATVRDESGCKKSTLIRSGDDVEWKLSETPAPNDPVSDDEARAYLARPDVHLHKCEKCGTKWAAQDTATPCSHCNGTGYLGSPGAEQDECKACGGSYGKNGTGQTIKAYCPGCGWKTELVHLPAANPCPVSYPHLPHDYCDGKPGAYRIGTKAKPKKEIPLCFVAAGLPEPAMEYIFHPKRKWRFDFAWPIGGSGGIALEVEGGVWSEGGGRHNRGQGFLDDMEKYNAAALLFWRVFRCVPDDLATGKAAVIILEAMGR